MNEYFGKDILASCNLKGGEFSIKIDKDLISLVILETFVFLAFNKLNSV